MAVVECKDCESIIPANAPVCPTCRRPWYASATEVLVYVVCVGSLLVLGVFVWALFYSGLILR
jgi:hypothetical protein